MITKCLDETLASTLDCGQEVHDEISLDSERRASQHDKQALCSLIIRSLTESQNDLVFLSD